MLFEGSSLEALQESRTNDPNASPLASRLESAYQVMMTPLYLIVKRNANDADASPYDFALAMK